jgi:hypothetical protein
MNDIIPQKYESYLERLTKAKRVKNVLIDMAVKVLILSSGLSAKQVVEYPYRQNGWTIVAVNNGWMACNEWDAWYRAGDYVGAFPDPRDIDGRPCIENNRVRMNEFGNIVERGRNITLQAAYWALRHKPKVIAFLGADMNYTPNENGDTHIYGVGYDIQRNGISDPDRLINLDGNGDPLHLRRIFLRFETIAYERGCRVYNLSHTIETRLPYERVKPENV